LIDDQNPAVAVIEFLTRRITDPRHAHELGDQLDALIRPELPNSFVIDFANVRSLGSSAFGAILSFAQKVGRVSFCNMREDLRTGACLIGLDLYGDFAVSRRAAVDEALRAATRGEEDTVDYPASFAEPHDRTEQAEASDPRLGSGVRGLGGNNRSVDNENRIGRYSTQPVRQRSEPDASRRSRTTLDDFGGRSDAPGG
jgi:anti-anti-sigma regulatory factor